MGSGSKDEVKSCFSSIVAVSQCDLSGPISVLISVSVILKVEQLGAIVPSSCLEFNPGTDRLIYLFTERRSLLNDLLLRLFFNSSGFG
jgi:hypothetical protein